MIPHTPKCFASHMGLWAVEQHSAREFYNAIRLGLIKAEAPVEGGRLAREVATVNGIRLIPVTGMMMRAESKHGGTSTVALRQEIRRAQADQDVRGIALVVNSPGGHTQGMEELAASVSGVTKPMRVYGQDMVGSAAYWMASQAQEISVSPMTMVGSIGTFTVLQDVSKALDAAGVELTLVSSGGAKGLGADGRVTPDLVAEVQKMVNFIDGFFAAAVKNGRGMTDEQEAAVHTGAVFTPAEALEANLIDRVETFESFLDRFASDVAQTNSRTAAASIAIARAKV